MLQGVVNMVNCKLPLTLEVLTTMIIGECLH
jgi:hypothetical protein